MSTTAPRDWVTTDGARVDVTRTYRHACLTVTGGSAFLTPETAREVAAALTRLADSIDPEGAEPTPVDAPVDSLDTDDHPPARPAPTVLELIDHGGEGVPHITNAVRLNGHPLTLAASAPVHLSMRENRAVTVTLTIHPDELHLIKEPHPDHP